MVLSPAQWSITLYLVHSIFLGGKKQTNKTLNQQLVSLMNLSNVANRVLLVPQFRPTYWSMKAAVTWRWRKARMPRSNAVPLVIRILTSPGDGKTINPSTWIKVIQFEIWRKLHQLIVSYSSCRHQSDIRSWKRNRRIRFESSWGSSPPDGCLSLYRYENESFNPLSLYNNIITSLMEKLTKLTYDLID